MQGCCRELAAGAGGTAPRFAALVETFRPVEDDRDSFVDHSPKPERGGITRPPPTEILT